MKNKYIKLHNFEGKSICNWNDAQFRYSLIPVGEGKFVYTTLGLLF